MATTKTSTPKKTAAAKAPVAAAKKAEGAAALKQIVDLMQTYDIASDAVTKAAAKASKSAAKAKSKAKDTGSVDGRAKVAPKFQDPVTGATWTGRGKCPKWFDAETAIKL